jgi:Fe-S cluster assembly protein SufD
VSTATKQTTFTQDAFDAFLAARQEPAWVRDLRLEAWHKSQELSLPSRKEEEWMRTDIRLLRLDRFGYSAEPAAQSAMPDALLSQGIDLAGRTATLDSHVVAAELADDLARQGVIFESLDTAVSRHGDLIKPYLSARTVNFAADKFAALHAAWWSGGTLLYVPRGVSISRPLHMLSALSAGGTDLGHTLVVLEEGAEATLLAETASTVRDAPGLHLGAIELIVQPGARLRYVNLQNWSSGVWHFAHQRGVLHRDARLQWTIAALGAKLAKVNQHVALAGPGAETQVNGVMFTEGRQHLSYHTLQHHQAPHCKSDLLYKAALQDESRTVWRGMIKVDRDAQRTDGYQRNDNLLLSDHARSDSIPGLEIEADDVRCTHGSTAGRVDDEQVFYCRTRGLTRKEAIRMIVAGFFQQIFDRITIDNVREALGQAIGRRIREYE